MISVLVVDDSALIRRLLTEIIEGHPLLSLAGAAPDAFVAKQMVNERDPDVITLDIEMPKVNGLTFLDRLMKARPTPVVMFSSLTEKGADATMMALELGAVDFIAKPKLDIAKNVQAFQQELTDKILAAAQVKVAKRTAPARKSYEISYSGTELVIGIGASTGGTEAIKEVLRDLPASFPAIVISQHMPPGFTASFAARLDSQCKMSVSEAKDGERILPGHIYIAPGNDHLKVVRSGADYRIKLDQGDKVSGHRPSVDVMFDSLAENVKANSLGVILTGMGKDGAAGLLNMRQQGAHTLAQNEQTCIVFGMPKEAIARGGASQVLGLDDVAQGMSDWVSQNSKGGRV